MKEKPVKGVYSNQNDRPDLDCSVCILRKEGCENAQEGKFCSRFRSHAHEPQGTDPNKLWEQGEPVEF